LGCNAKTRKTIHGPADDAYFVGQYDPERDPAEDVREAARIATQQNKRILLQVGGDWCSWCHRMTEFFHQQPNVAETLRNGFVLIKVNRSDENTNAEFLEQFPPAEGFPYLIVLESDGTFLHAQDTAELEEGSSYSETALLDFLSQWVPPARLD
jgi:thiol-disulfide isomerase/thioredoxin